MNKQIKIEVNGLEKPLVDVNKLVSAIEALENGFADLTSTTDKLGNDLAKSFKSLENAVKDTGKGIKDDLGKSLINVEGLGLKLANTLRDGFKQINLASLESLDTFFDFETEFRDKMINLANVAGNLAEAFGPIGMAASFGLQLIAPLFGDLMVSMQKANKEAYRHSQIMNAVEDAEQKVNDELDQAVIKLGALEKETKQTKQAKIELTLANARLEAAEYQLGEAFGAELSQLNAVYDAMLDVNLATEDRANAIDTFMSSYGSYLSGLEREKVTLQDIVGLYEEQVAGMLRKDITSKYEAQFKALQGIVMEYAKEVVEAQAKLDEMDTAGPFSKSQGREGKSYDEWKAKVDAAQEKLLKAQQEEKKIREQINGEVTAYGKALGLTVNINGKNTKLANEQYSATKNRRMEEQKITEEKIKQSKLNLATFYNDRAQGGENEDPENTEDLNEAETRARRRRQRKQTEIDVLKEQNLAMGDISKKIAESRKRIDLAEEERLNAAKARLKSLEQLVNLPGTVYAQDLGVDVKDLNIPKEIEKQFKSVVKGREAYKQFIFDATKTDYETAMLDYKTLLEGYLNGTIETEDELFKELANRGITSLMQYQVKRSQDNLSAVRKQEEATIDAYEEAKRKGYHDTVKMEQEADDELNKALDNIDKKRKARAKKTQEVEMKAAQATNLLTGPLGTLNLDNYKKEIMDKNEVAIKDVLKDAEDVLGGYNKEGKLYITFSSDSVSVGNLNELVEAGKITREEMEKALELASQYNKQISGLVKQGQEELANAEVTFGEKAFEYIKANLERTIRSLDVDLESGLLKWEARYNEALEANTKAIEKRGALVGKALKKSKEESQRLLAELEPLKQAEIAKVGGIYLQKLQEIINNGGDVSLIMKELNLEITKVINKYAEMEKQANELIPEKQRLTTQNYVDMATEATNALMNIGQGFNDYLSMLSDNLISSLEESLSNVESQISDASSRLASLEDDLEGKVSGRRDAVLAAIELEKQRNDELQKRKIALEKQLLKEQEKAARRRKAIAISEAVISGALGIMRIWAAPQVIPSPAGEIIKAVNTAALATTTALQVATISQQKFAEGGFTGDGTSRDETGYKVAGVVHEGEWVAPKWMVDNPSFKGVISSLEASRQRGYAIGGPVSTDVLDGINASLNPNSDIIRQMKVYTDAAIKLSNRPVIADVKEFSNVQSSMMRRMSTNSIG